MRCCLRRTSPGVWLKHGNEGSAQMKEYDVRLAVPLSAEEWAALKEAARMDLRQPRDQARAILREALAKTVSTENKTGALTGATQNAG